MKCLNCGQDNKDTAKVCKKCSRDLTLAPSWFPTWRWHVRTLATIYAALIALFFTARFILAKLPPPYNIRYIPPEMTPWLKNRPEPKITAPNAFDYMSASAVEYGTSTAAAGEEVSKKDAAADLRRAREVLRIEAQAVQGLIAQLNGSFTAAIERILSAKGRVAVVGMGKSGLVGRKISATLSSTGTPAMFLHPAEGLHGDMGMLSEGDIVLAISYSGETEELKQLLPFLRAKEIPVLALTGRPNSRLAKLADVVLSVAVRREACPYNVTPTASTTATLALGDALAMALMERRRFGREDFARLHPGGTLGKLLTLRVADVMHDGAENPVVGQERTVQEALAEMTRTRLGATSVVDNKGRLIGFFTDGDLRRSLQKDPALLHDRISRVMTRRPITVSPADMASEAVRLIKRHGVDNLPVTDKTGRPVGIVDERDLLAEGLT